MAKNKIVETERTLFVSESEAKAKIESRIEAGKQILEQGLKDFNNLDKATKDYQKWNSYNCTLLKTLVSDDIYQEYDSGIYFGYADSGFEDPYELMTEFKNKLEEKIHDLESILQKLPLLQSKRVSPPVKSGNTQYVHLERIETLRKLTTFDSAKLVRLCEELNLAHQSSAVYSIAMLVRAITDHVPPVFGQKNFDNVVSQHGGKSFKELMEKLNSSSRKIADEFLHSQMSKKENVPTMTRVDFSNELDVLLGEVERLAK